MILSVESRFRAVEKLVISAQQKGLDPEIASSFCKLGCVMICGAIERSVEILITERIAKRSAPQITPFLKSFFKRGSNYDCDDILELLYKFDQNWGNKFKIYISCNAQIKTAISSCYASRNSIAHGGTQSLGPQILRQYYDNSFTLIVELENLIRN